MVTHASWYENATVNKYVYKYQLKVDSGSAMNDTLVHVYGSRRPVERTVLR